MREGAIILPLTEARVECTPGCGKSFFYLFLII